MAKTRGAEKAAQADEEDRADGLEIISIGSLYKGAWDKKYWTTSRGKDRYPYPVGYQAVRAYNGITYTMEICEGVNGPRFLISCDDGSSSSGKTPDQAWEEFQKKGCPRIKIWHGKRLSSKMDGLELFGFKNQFIQRLLRELVANINRIAERSLVSPNVCDGVTRTDHDDCCPNVGAYPDLLLCLGKPCVTGKRSRCELKNKKLNVRARPQSPEFTCSRPSNVKNEKSLGQGSSTTHYGSEVHEVHNQIGVPAALQRISSVCKSSNCISSKNELLLNPIVISDDKKMGAVPSKGLTGFLYSENCKTTELTENLSTEEPLHRSYDVEVKISNLLVTSEDKKLMQSCSKEPVGCIDIDLCAPDTLDFVQENTPDSAPNELDKNAYNETACEITSGDLLNAENEEMLRSNSNPSSEKSDFGSAGQDMAKSMMSLLLPQAVPLLRNVSTHKEFTISPSNMLPSQVNSKDEQNKIGYSLDVPSSADVIMIEAAHGEQGEKIHGYTDPHSNTSNSEHMKSIVPDSFENSQGDDYKTNLEILSFDIAEAGRSSFNKEICSQQLLGHDLPNGISTCHASGLDFKDKPQNCDVCIPESVLDDMSPKDLIISERSDDTCSDLKENPVHVGLSFVQKDLSTAQDFTGGVSNAFSGVKTKSCQLESTETLAEMTQDEVVGKTGNAETMIMSSKLPKLVYTRKKLRNAIPFQENCSVMECAEYEKFKLVTPEMYTAKDTLPPSETIVINNSNDKSCEPNDTTGLCVETPQTHGDVLGGHSNLVEPNPSSQNPTLFADENKCFGTKEAQLISEPMSLQNQELKNNLGSSVKFVGCYLHPMPVSSLFLSTREDEIHVCVLCGHLTGQCRTLFTYKVAITEPSIGCPSVMAHSSILLPDPKHNFIKETMEERSGVQLTPDGQYIVLIGSIKTPNCREGKIDCYCSTCTSVCTEKNILKIVQVEHGYVSVVTTLESVDNVHCILVCEPNRLVFVGESGRLQVWVMNSTWSEKIEYFIIPADGSVSPGIVELKRVPKCTHLVVGHNSCGEFSLWDIAKRNCVTSFSALRSPINEFFPISLFQWQTKGSGFSYASIEEQSDKLLETTNLWYSEQRETSWFSPSEEDVAMWLFVLTTSDLDCCHNHVSTSSSYDIHTARSWRLALLMKNSISFGSPMDLRTSGIGVSCGYGIISTSDGVVYMWELSKGSKLGTLHHFQDGNVTCVATDDSRGALGVAGGGGQLLLYLHLPELDSN
ncbi:nucleus protein [Spatholobus suberectus]|nr:nucleus protein [Spatholobus suberectus]